MRAIIFRIVFITLFLVGFNYGCKEKADRSSTQSTFESQQPDITPENAKSLSLEILNSYYAVKDALVDSDFEVAKKKAGELAVEFKKDNDTFNMVILAESIAGARTINDQRIEFEKLSKEMYSLAKSSKFQDVTIYRLYCPMAFDNKGAYWLSDQKEIMNPYFGDTMLRCGRLEETISR